MFPISHQSVSQKRFTGALSNLMKNGKAEARLAGGRARVCPADMKSVWSCRGLSVYVCVSCSLVPTEVIQRNLSTSRRNPSTPIDPSAQNTSAAQTRPLFLSLFLSVSVFVIDTQWQLDMNWGGHGDFKIPPLPTHLIFLSRSRNWESQIDCNLKNVFLT